MSSKGAGYKNQYAKVNYIFIQLQWANRKWANLFIIASKKNKMLMNKVNKNARLILWKLQNTIERNERNPN